MLRALKLAGVTSSTRPRPERRTTTLRPFSWGRSSIQQTSSPSSWTWLRPTAPAAAASALIGERQEPKGAISAMSDQFSPMGSLAFLGALSPARSQPGPGADGSLYPSGIADENCIFCRIVGGQEPASFVYQDQLV